MIHVHLSPPELRHFRDLYGGAGYFKLDPNLDAKGKRERIIASLESVLFRERVRDKIGEHDVRVLPQQSEKDPTWQTFGA